MGTIVKDIAIDFIPQTIDQRRSPEVLPMSRLSSLNSPDKSAERITDIED